MKGQAQSLTPDILVESKVARDNQLATIASDDRALEILDKAKALYQALWTGGCNFATIEQIADYYEVGMDGVHKIWQRAKTKPELLADGCKLLKGKELRDVMDKLSIGSKASGLVGITPRGAVRIGFFLTDSEVAAQVRTIALNLIETVVPAQSDRIRELELELELTRERKSLAEFNNTIAQLHGFDKLALIQGRPDAVIEIREVVDRTVIVDSVSLSPIATFDGVGITYLAKRYGFGKGTTANKKCRAWLKLIGITEDDWEPEITAHKTPKLPRDKLKEIDRAFADKKGDRQTLLGENAS